MQYFVQFMTLRDPIFRLWLLTLMSREQHQQQNGKFFATHFPFHMISGCFLVLSQFEKECRIFDKYHKMCAISEAGHVKFLEFLS